MDLINTLKTEGFEQIVLNHCEDEATARLLKIERLTNHLRDRWRATRREFGNTDASRDCFAPFAKFEIERAGFKALATNEFLSKMIY